MPGFGSLRPLFTGAPRGAGLGVLACFIGGCVDVAWTLTHAHAGSSLAVASYAIALSVLFGALVGGSIAAWVSFFDRLLGPLGRGRGVAHASLTALPLVAFVAWVPSDWILSKWSDLAPSARSIAVAAWLLMALAPAASVWFASRWWSRREADEAEQGRTDGVLMALFLVLALFCFWADATLYAGLYPTFHSGLAGAFLLSLAVASSLGARFWARWRKRGSTASLGRIGFFGSAASLVLLVLLELGDHAAFGPSRSLIFAQLTAVARSLTDVDRDGFSSLLGGSDCAPLDRGIGRNAFDVAGNGRDEDCTGSDMRWPPAPPCGAPAQTPSRHNVLLVTVDALRADRLSSYGNQRQTSPRLDALARSGLRFSRAYSQASYTRDSLPSFFTGLYPSNIPREYDDPSPSGGEPFQIRNTVPVLAELLRDHGYDTMGLCGFQLPEKAGLARGFRFYETARRLTPRATKFLRTAKEPFFLWLHYTYPHEPYVRHPDFDFGDGDLDRYDGEVAHSDREIGRLLDELEKAGRTARTLVVVSADHGEEFGEHGGYFHSSKLYRELVHVPLIVKLPGGPSGVVEDVVELVDVVPTIVRAVGVPRDCSDFDGRDLLRERSGRTDDAEGAYSENFLRHRVTFRSLFTGRWRIIEDLEVDRVELYDTLVDPNEQHDVSRARPEVTRRLLEAASTRPLRSFSALLGGSGPGDGDALARSLSRMQRDPLLELGLARMAGRPVPAETRPHVERLLERPELGVRVRERTRVLLEAAKP